MVCHPPGQSVHANYPYHRQTSPAPSEAETHAPEYGGTSRVCPMLPRSPAQVRRQDGVEPARCPEARDVNGSRQRCDREPPGSESRSAKERRMPQMHLNPPPLKFEPALHRPRPHRSGPAASRPIDSDDARDVVSGSCRFIGRNDERCAGRFLLGHLDQMLDICLGTGSSGCLMYHRLRMEEEQGIVVSNSPIPHLVTLTHDGESLRLRPTGS